MQCLNDSEYFRITSNFLVFVSETSSLNKILYMFDCRISLKRNHEVLTELFPDNIAAAN